MKKEIELQQNKNHQSMSHFLHPLDSNSLFKEVIIKHQPRPITIEAAYSDRNIIDKQ